MDVRTTMLALAVLLSVLNGEHLRAEDPPRPEKIPSLFSKSGKGGEPALPMGKRPLETRLQVELLTGLEGNGFRTQFWARFLEEVQVPFRIHRGSSEDRPELKEKMIGTSLREVSLRGWIEPDGSVVFPNRRFTERDRNAFKIWLKELQTYGAQGEPQGRPFWGLSKAQFDALYEQLTNKVTLKADIPSLDRFLAVLQIPAEFPLKLGYDIREKWNLQFPLTPPKTSFSKGFLLAYSLRNVGLGFYPRRTPTGEIELEVVTLADRGDVWPVGWPVTTAEFKLVPTLFELNTFQMSELPMKEFLTQLEELAQVPLLQDEFALRNDRIRPEQETAHLPSRRSVWMTVVQGVLFKSKLRCDILTDEAGQPLLWITSAPPRTGLGIPSGKSSTPKP